MNVKQARFPSEQKVTIACKELSWRKRLIRVGCAALAIGVIGLARVEKIRGATHVAAPERITSTPSTPVVLSERNFSNFLPVLPKDIPDNKDNPLKGGPPRIESLRVTFDGYLKNRGLWQWGVKAVASDSDCDLAKIKLETNGGSTAIIRDLRSDACRLSTGTYFFRSTDNCITVKAIAQDSTGQIAAQKEHKCEDPSKPTAL